MSGFITTLVVLVAVAIIVIVLLQRSKSGGGLGAVAGGQTEAMFGANATTVLAKATTWLIGIFFALTIILTMVNNGSQNGKSRLSADDNEAPAAPAVEKVAPKADAAADTVKEVAAPTADKAE